MTVGAISPFDVSVSEENERSNISSKGSVRNSVC